MKDWKQQISREIMEYTKNFDNFIGKLTLQLSFANQNM